MFQVWFQILMAASYLCLWEIDLCSIWGMQAKPYRFPNCFSCHYHDPPFFNQSYNTHKYWMKKKSSEYCINDTVWIAWFFFMILSCFKLVTWYEYDILVTYVWIQIFLIWKLKPQNPFWEYFSLVLLRGSAVAVMFYGAPSFCRLTLSVCVMSKLGIPTPLVFKL